MTGRIPSFKDETGKLISRLSRVQNRECKLAAWIGLPAFLCFAFFSGRILGRTLDGDDLDFVLFQAGAIIGLAVGVWRSLLVAVEAHRQGEPPDHSSSSNWKLKQHIGFVLVYVVIGTVFARSTGALLNRFIPVGQTRTERALVSQMPSSRGKRPDYRLVLQMFDRQETQHLQVSTWEYQKFRVLDIVEIRYRTGVFGYDCIMDILRVGSQRVGSTP